MNSYNKNFIDIDLSPETVFVYSVRKLLQKALDKSLPIFHGKVLDLGCGEMPYKQYILDRNNRVLEYVGVDIDNSKYHQKIKPDFVWDGKKIAMGDSTFDTVMATELFEHLPNIEDVMNEIHRVLSKDGILFFTFPFIWPLHETPYDECRYTPYAMERILKKAGFCDIKITPLGGYHSALAQMICIWFNQYKQEMHSDLKIKIIKKAEKYILFPIIRKLMKKDREANINNYGENTMSPGFYGYAKK